MTHSCSSQVSNTVPCHSTVQRATEQ